MKKYNYAINGIKYEVEIVEVEGNLATVEVNGTRYEVEIEQPTIKEKPLPRVSTPTPRATTVTSPSPQPSTTPTPAGGGTGTNLTSPLPGVILRLEASVGDTVKKGQRIMVLEAMKMENDIKANADGTILSLAVREGDSIQEGALLATIG